MAGDRCAKEESAKCAVATLDHYANVMCACPDKACADKVNEQFTAWGTHLAKAAAGRNEKPDPQVAAMSSDVMQRYAECMTKLIMREAPPPDPCGGGDDPCG